MNLSEAEMVLNYYSNQTAAEKNDHGKFYEEAFEVAYKAYLEDWK